eukprot:Hpha_TRINITY_DN16275_c2_g6::TRINITY_DN16275_c2_g6_i2::g.16132::m.16132
MDGFQEPHKEKTSIDSKFFGKLQQEKEMNYFLPRSEGQLPERSTSFKNLSKAYSEYVEFWQPKTVSCSADVPGLPVCTAKKRPKDKTVTFEFSPYYARAPGTPARMKMTLPHWSSVKLLFLVRSPSSRSVSDWLEVTWSKFQASLPESIRLGVSLFKKCYPLAAKIGNCAAMRPRPTMLKDACYVKDGRAVEWTNYMDFRSKYVDPKSGFLVKGGWNQCEGEKVEPVCARLGVFVIEGGMYADHMESFTCNQFRPQQFLVIPTGALKEPLPVLKQVADHLGIPSQAVPKRLGSANKMSRAAKLNQTNVQVWKQEVMKMTESIFDPASRRFLHMLTTMPFRGDRMAVKKELFPGSRPDKPVK